jgi:hypothetical protein
MSSQSHPLSQYSHRKLTIPPLWAHSPTSWVSQHNHRKLTILFTESLDTFTTGSSHSYYLSISTLSLETNNPIIWVIHFARSSQSRHYELSVPFSERLHAVASASHQRGLGAGLLTNNVDLVFFAFALRHLASQLWWRCGAAWEINWSTCNTKAGPLT